MPQERLSIVDMVSLLTAGYANLSGYYRVANNINVFPVADGDTGNNIKTTLEGVLSELTPEESMDRFLNRAAHLFSKYGRGNSGKILSLFFQNFFTSLNYESDSIRLEDFVAAADFSIDKTWDILSESGFRPREGTILTTIKSAFENIDTAADLVNGFSTIYEGSIRGLEATIEKNEVLKRNGVVDSGGLCFVYMVEGMYNHLSRSNLHYDKYDNVSITNIQPSDSQADYCFEFNIRVEVSVEELGRKLNEIGENGLLLRLNEKDHNCHVHITGANLQLLLNYLTDRNLILQDFKLDNFGEADQDQTISEHPEITGTRPAVIVNTYYSIPAAISSLPHIFVIDGYIQIGDEVYKNSKVTTDMLEAALEKSLKVTTSHPTLADFEDLFSRILSEGYDSILSITQSSRSSGAHNTAQIAAMTSKHSDRILVFDNGQANGTNTAYIKGVSDKLRGGLSFTSLLDYVTQCVSKTRMYFAADGGALSARGYLSSAQRSLVSNSNITLFTYESGLVKVAGVVPSEEKASDFFLDMIRKDLSGGNKQMTIGISNNNGSDFLSRFDDKVRAEFGTSISELYLNPLPPTVRLSLGKNGFGIVYMIGENGL